MIKSVKICNLCNFLVGVINVANGIKATVQTKNIKKIKYQWTTINSLNKNQQIATDLSFLEIIQPNKNNKFNDIATKKPTLLPAAQVCFKHRT